MGEDDGQDLDGGGRPKFADLLDPTGTSGRPVAVTLPAAAELLAAPWPGSGRRPSGSSPTGTRTGRAAGRCGCWSGS